MLFGLLIVVCWWGFSSPATSFAFKMESGPPPALDGHLQTIAKLAKAAPMIDIPEGWFLMATVRKDNDPFGLETQYDDTEFPQRRIWLDHYFIDRDEVSMAEYLVFLHQEG